MDGFFLVDGDVVAEQEVFDRICNAEWGNALCGDTKKDIEVLVKVDGSGRITRISKEVRKEEAKFGSIGIHKFSKEAALLLFPAIQELFEEKGRGLIYEHAFEKILDKAPIHVVDVTGLRWREIDTPKEYKQAVKLFKDLR